MLKLIALIVPLAVDSFVVSTAIGTAALDQRTRWRVSATLAAFEAGMPLIGLGLGSPVGHAIGSAADYVAAALLIGVGLYVVLESDDEETEVRLVAAARGWGLIALAFSVSLDELAIGFGFGTLRVPVLPALILIAVQAIAVSQVGLRLGGSIPEPTRERAETAAGVLLIAIGVAVAAQRLT